MGEGEGMSLMVSFSNNCGVVVGSCLSKKVSGKVAELENSSHFVDFSSSETFRWI